MNKKFSTLLVSSLLLGGALLSPVSAALNDASLADPTTGITISITNSTLTKNVEDGVYYLIKVNNAGAPSMINYSLQATKDGVSCETQNVITPYNMWKVVPQKTNGLYNGNFKLVNAAGITLAVKKNGANYEFANDGQFTEFKQTGNTIAVTNQGQFLTWNGSSLVWASSAATLQVALFEPKSQVMSTTDLNGQLDAGFGLQIGFINNDNAYEEYNLQGNAFAGTLKALTTLSSTTAFDQIPAAGSKEVYLYNPSTKKVVVLLNEKWSKQNTDLIPDVTDPLKGYKFTTMTPKELKNQEAADAAAIAAGGTAKIKSYIFQISEPNAVVQSPLEVAVKISDNEWAELLVAEVNGSYLLTTATAANEETGADALTLAKADYVGAKTIVRFGDNNLVNPQDFWGAAWNITRLSDENTLFPDVDMDGDGNLDWVEASHVAYTRPEGQWILNEDYEWTNRETTEATTGFDVQQLRTTSESGIYRIGDEKYSIVKAAELGGQHFEYFGDLEPSETGVNRTYTVMFKNNVTDELAYIGRDGLGNVLLTKDASAAIPFQAKKMKTTDNAVVVDGDDVNANIDVFDIVSEYMKYNTTKKVWEVKEDTVSFYRYTLSYDGQYLNYSNNKYSLGDTKGAFVFKLKDGDLVNIISVDPCDFDVLDDPSHEDVDLTMMYFDFSFALPQQQANIYHWVSNAQLNVVASAAPEYRTLAAPTTLEFFRTEFSDEFLFENGEFAGMTYNRQKYNPAIYVDTAYVRNNTTKPYYMLAVGVDETAASKVCPFDPEHNTEEYLAEHPDGCPHAETTPGWIEARYLVSFTDSVAAHQKELNHKFYYKNTEMTKLGFVPALHYVDTLVIANDENEIVVGNTAVHPAKFAFRIVDAATEDFIIETAKLKHYDHPEWGYTTNYIKWHNGCPVLTADINEAEVFNVRSTEAEATANEAVAAEVSVVAAQGAIIVKGAAGKVVTVANILGQTIANQVAASDNVTIAAPAGIAVVTVDGEATKVVVK